MPALPHGTPNSELVPPLNRVACSPGTKEFVLEAPPEPRTKFVEVDPGASQMLMNFMIGSGFMCKRVGYLYGKWVEDAEGQLGVQAREGSHSDLWTPQ